MECILEKNNKKVTCYCGSQKSYNDCCFPFLSGKLIPETPEQLMRSRYSAFCIKNIEYLISTHHPSRRQPDERDLLNQTINTTQWFGLKILTISKNKISQGIGYV
jgi:SEC-C motif-containing protein